MPGQLPLLLHWLRNEGAKPESDFCFFNRRAFSGRADVKPQEEMRRTSCEEWLDQLFHQAEGPC